MMSVTYQNKNETFRLELATLFEQHKQTIYKAAYSVTIRRQDAEDVLQTVFLRLMEEPRECEAAAVRLWPETESPEF